MLDIAGLVGPQLRPERLATLVAPSSCEGCGKASRLNEFLLKHGQIDRIVPRQDPKPERARLLSLRPAPL